MARPLTRTLLALATSCALVSTLGAAPAGAAPDGRTTVFLAGDSTVASYSAGSFPLTGWGQRLGELLDSDVRVDNRALGGRSAKSYVLEGHLERLLADVEAGDYLLVQFGHNDRQNTDDLCPANPSYCNRHTEPYGSFKEYLQKYIDGARARGATPVLVTPMGRRNFDSQGRFLNDFLDYATAMRQLAAANDIELVDLNRESIAFYTRIGPPATEEVFLYTEPLEHDAYPTGREDNIHFQHYGAGWLARMVAQGLAATDLPLATDVVIPDLDPEDLAAGAVVTASSSTEADGSYRWNVADGQRAAVPQGRGWRSQDATLDLTDHSEWVQVDLGQVSPVTRVALTPVVEGDAKGVHFPVDYAVQLSQDGVAWTDAARIQDAPAPGATVEHTLPATPARYVRVLATSLRQDPRDLRWRAELAEPEVFSDLTSVSLRGPSELADGASGVYTVQLRSPRAQAAPQQVELGLQVPDGWTASPVSSPRGGAARWQVTAPASGREQSAVLRATATYLQDGRPGAVEDVLTVGRPQPPAPLPAGHRWVSELPFVESVNGYGPVERDTSNGGNRAGDGRRLSVGRVEHDKGLGVHADSAVAFALPGCTRFTAVVGVDDEVGTGGTVAFLVEGDGEVLFTHPLARGGDAGVPVDLDVTGVRQLRLVVDDLGNKGNDHGDWASAALTGCTG